MAIKTNDTRGLCIRQYTGSCRCEICETVSKFLFEINDNYVILYWGNKYFSMSHMHWRGNRPCINRMQNDNHISSFENTKLFSIIFRNYIYLEINLRHKV
jgi:hypothetical protein